jgi:hypothetical protein
MYDRPVDIPAASPISLTIEDYYGGIPRLDLRKKAIR